MSLRVWLPFTGDLHNQGLDQNIIITGVNTTINASGKTGASCTFNGSSSYLQSNATFLDNDSDTWSFSCWFKPNTAHQGCLFCNRSEGNSSGITVFYYNTQFLIDDGTRWTLTPSVAVTVSAWNHLVVTREKDVAKKFYLNGTLIDSITTTGTQTKANATNFYIGVSYPIGQYNWFNGDIADVRIYDHVLSAKEVKEISRALVVHYKLDTNEVGTPNLLRSSGFMATDRTGWPSNSSTDWTKYLRYYNGSSSIHTFSGNVDTIKLNAASNLGICFVRKATDIDLDPDSYYTISCRAKSTQTSKPLCIGLSYYNSENTWVWRGGSNGVNFKQVNQWQDFSLTFKPDADTQYICYCFTVYGVKNGTNTFSITQCKLEKGEKVTPWCPNELDSNYNNDVATSSIIYDSSGYRRNGTVIGTLVPELVTPKYERASYMNNTDSANHIECNETITIPTDGISVSFWAKFSKTKGQVLYIDQYMSFAINTAGTFFFVNRSSDGGFPTTSILDNQWNHIVLTRAGSTYKAYVNGTAITKGTTKTNWSHNVSKIYLLNRSYNNNYAADAAIVDFREYATVLSATDVKELYNNSLKIVNGVAVPRSL